MAIDTSIALGVRPPQFQTIDPMTVYSAMEGQRLNALRERALEQEMQRNALIMQNTMEDRRAAAAKAALERRQREELLRTFRGGYQQAKNPVMGPGTIQGATPASFDYEGVKNKLIGAGQIDAFKTVSELQEQEAKRREAEAKATGQGFTNIKTQAETLGVLTENQKKTLELADAQLKQISMGIDRAPSIEAINMLYDANPEALAVTGKTPAQAKAIFAQRAAEVGFDRARMEVANGVMAVQKQLSDEVKTLETPQGYVEYRPGTGVARPITVGGQPIMPADKRTIGYEPASEAVLKKSGEALVADQQALKTAPFDLENLEQAKALIPEAKTFMGPSGQLKMDIVSFFNNTFGTTISTEALAAGQTLESRLFRGVMDNLKKMDSQPTQEQQRALQKALGELKNDPTALARVIEVMQDAIRERVNDHNKRVSEAEGKGITGAYDLKITLPPKPSAAGAGRGAATGAGGGTTFTPPAGWSHVVK